MDRLYHPVAQALGARMHRPYRKSFRAGVLLAGFLACTSLCEATAGPIDIVIDPAPQAFSNTCQSYSLGLAMAFEPTSPYQAGTATELRDLEENLRQAIDDSVSQHPKSERPDGPIRDDWRAAVEKVTSNALTVKWKSFNDLDSAMRFVGDKTNVTDPESLGTTLSAALVKTPVLLSFKRVQGSSYSTSHIVTVFGVELPQASLAENAHPKLVIVNSAVKYAGGVKNVCSVSDLSDADRYQATSVLTDDYDFNLFSGNTYLVTWVEPKN